LVALNHFTVPIVIYFSKMRKCALRPHDLRAGLIRFQRCLGEGSRFGAINKANRLFECAGVYPIARRKASDKKQRDQRPAGVGPLSPALKRFARRDRHCSREKFAKILFLLRGLTLLG
jgi:hypothetical protein